jgi:hypothetical protein
MGGFECTDKLNCFGRRVDFLAVTGHLEQLDEDYRNLSLLNIKSVREGIRWSKVEQSPYRYDWKDTRKIIECSTKNGIQVIWDICHFGFPDDLTPLHPMFARRFARLCREFVLLFRSINPEETLIITPINEVSFLSWLGGDVAGTSPYCKGNGWEVKYALMKAYIEAIRAVKELDENVLIMVTEPLVNMVPRLGASESEIIEAAGIHESQYQVMDMLTGRTCEELNGHPDYVEILGCNYYHNNQWVVGTSSCLPWANENADERWLPLSAMMVSLYEKYQKPIVLSETSHPGEHKPFWMQFVAEQCARVLDAGIPLWGICWYPIIDRPDWDHLHPWHKAGIWDVETSESGQLTRVLDPLAATAFINAQNLLRKSYHLVTLPF